MNNLGLIVNIASIQMDITSYIVLIISFIAIILVISSFTYFYTKNNVLSISVFFVLFLIGVILGIIPILFLIVSILIISSGLAYIFIKGVV
jgi:hypothetical protein